MVHEYIDISHSNYKLGSVISIPKMFPRINSIGVCFFNGFHGNHFKFENDSTHIHLIISLSFVELET